MIQLVYYDKTDGSITGTFRFIGPEEEEQEYAKAPNAIVVEDLTLLTKDSSVDLKTLTITNLKQVAAAK